MEIRPSWEEALAFPTGKRVEELEVEEEDIEEKDVESCSESTEWGSNKGGWLLHQISGCCRRRLVSGGKAIVMQKESGFSQVRGLRLVAAKEERLLVGVGVAVNHNRGGAASHRCGGCGQSRRRRRKIRLALRQAL
ncbi:hypothetical protein BHE74_00023098 [Ensete ventricosum]|nr:hypothetical protein BHE74_00023098 [Ensete ventricosum]